MKRKNAVRTAVLALALALSLAGCGGSINSTTAAADSVQEYATESFAAGEGAEAAGAPLLDPAEIETGESARVDRKRRDERADLSASNRRTVDPG